jgi:ComF family protein
LAIPDLIIPVPLHPKRLRWRGFNQAELLAKYLGENMTPGFSLPVLSDVLIRQKNTTTQMKIKNYSERQKNMEGAFGINKENNNLIRSKNILLVDDVATTGSTLFECARILKKSGAASVFGIVVARQEFKK